MKKILLFSLLVLFAAPCLYAQWDANPATVNNPVCTSPYGDLDVRLITDGNGGIIATGASNNTIWCQRKTAAGVVLWGDTANPVILFGDAAFTTVSPVDILPDGSGGAYITWNFYFSDTTSHVYLQHVSSGGQKLFGDSGILVNPPNGRNAYSGKLCNTAQGVIICWNEIIQHPDSLVPSIAEVFVQRFSDAGLPQWGSGVPVSTVEAFRIDGEITSDNNNGAFVAFLDTRNSQFDSEGGTDNLDVYAQHISSTGIRLWGAGDAVVSAAPYNQATVGEDGSQSFSSIISDSAGGFIIIYETYLNDTSFYQLLSQRLDGNGIRLWDTSGIGLYTPFPDFNTTLVQTMSDGANGAVVAWTQWDINNSNGNLYAQRISASGNKEWTTDGVVVGNIASSGEYGVGTITRDGSGFYIAAWVNTNDYVIKGQKINYLGQLVWPAGGVDICTNPNSIPRKPVLAPSSVTSTIAVWLDERNYNSNNIDLYAAKINSNGGGLISALVYTSIANGNWNNPAIWQGGIVPPTGADVVVHSAVIVNVNVTCNSLTVQTPGSIRANPGINITVLH